MDDLWRRATSRQEYQQLLQTTHSRTQRPASCCDRILRGCKRLPHSPLIWAYLILLGIIAAFLGSIMDYCVASLLSIRRSMTIDLELFGIVGWVGWCCILALAASYTTEIFSLVADGSGIPRIKNILSNQSSLATQALSYRTLVAKCIGLILAAGSGLSVGKEGPFIHIMSIVAHKLDQLHCFRKGSQGYKNFDCIRAGVAAGVTAVFGTPLGGVLFSIEVTANYYAVSNLWQGVICSSVCVLTFELIRVWKEDVLFENTSFDGFEMTSELFAFLMLGLVAGLVSASFVNMIVQLHRWRKKFPLLNKRYIYVGAVAFTSALLCYPFACTRLHDRQVINQMFRNEPLSNDAWKDLTLGFLLLYSCVKILATLLPCGIPLPCGIFTPVFTIGAVVGRTYGEVMLRTFPELGISPATYAVVGAAALTSAATHTVSTAIIVFELTGQLSHMLPVLLTVLVAYSVGGFFAPSVYETLSDLSGIERLPDLTTASNLDLQTAEGNMVRDIPFLTLDSTYQDFKNLLKNYPMLACFAVCEDAKSKILIGAVNRSDMEVVLQRLHEEDTEDTDKENEVVDQTDLPFLAQIQRSKSVEDQLEDVVVQVDDPDAVFNKSMKQALTCPRSPRKAIDEKKIRYGPPVGPLSYSAIPVDSYPPQVGHRAPMHQVYVLCNLCFWMRVFVTKNGRLLGMIQANRISKMREQTQ